MAERRNSLQPEPVVPRNNKRRRTMMDSVSEVARWLLPSWASEGNPEASEEIHRQTTSGHHQAGGSALSNGERNAKRSRPNEVSRMEPMGRLSPVASKVPQTTSTQMDADFDDGSDSSTSGCSSLSISALPAAEPTSAADAKANQRRNRPIQNTKESKTRDVSISVDQTSIVAETSVTASPSLNFSLFSRPSRALSSTMNSSLPLTGSGASGTRSLSSSLQRPERSLNRSIFYEGKTTYGGAAAHRKLNLFSPSPYQIAAKRSKPASNVNVSESSSAAKRLIEALERMNTPVQNAKKIPLGRSETAVTQNSEARRKEALESIASLRQSSAPLPPLSSCRSNVLPCRIGSNVKPVLSSTEYPIDIDDATPPSHKSNVPVITQTPRPVSAALDGNERDRASAAGGKIKTVKSYEQRPGRKIPVEEEPPPASPELPPVRLQIKDLPSFSFVTKPPSVTVPSSQDCHKSASTRSPLTSLADFSNKPFEKQQLPSPLVCSSNEASEAFSFAAPIDLDKPTKTLHCKEVFDFKDPLYLKKDLPNRSVGFTVGASTMISGGTFNLKTKPTATTDRIAKFAPVAEALSTGSVMDILGRSEPRKDVVDANQASSSPRSSIWECPECRVQSPSGSCHSCESKKPSTSATTVGFQSSTSTLPPIANSWGDQFKKSSSSWDCSECFLNNKSDVSSCPACGAAKPGAKPSGSTFGAPVASQSGDLFKMPSTPTPSSAPVSTASTSPPSTTVKAPLSAMIKMAPGWSCDICLLRNDLDKTKCVACETPKPGSAPAPVTESAPAAAAATSAFKFGVPTSDVNKNTTSEPVIPIFGVKSADNAGSESTAVPNGTFKFGVPQTSKPAAEKSSTEQTSSGTSANALIGNSVFSFGSPALSAAPVVPQSPASIAPAALPSVTSVSSSAAPNPLSTATASTGFGSFGGSWSTTPTSKTDAAPSALFSFGSASTASTTSAPSTATVTATTASANFTFGTSSTALTTPVAQPSAATFSFGRTGTSTPAVPATTTAPAATLTFGGFATPAKAPASGGLFGSGSAATSLFGGNTTVTTATSSQPTASTAAYSFPNPTLTGTAATQAVTAPTTTQSAASPMFTFGKSLGSTPASFTSNPTPAPASTTDTQNSATVQPSFVFGNRAASPAPLTGYNFGSTTSANTSATSTAPTFSFGSAATNPLPNAAATGPSVFGSGSLQSSTPAFGVTNPNPAAPATNNVFQFATNPASATPASTTPFGFTAGGTPAAATPASGGLFAFGSGGGTPAGPASAPNSAIGPGATTPFQFGTTATTAAPTPAATPALGGGFAFGTAATPAPPFQFGSSQGQGAPSFQFPAPVSGPTMTFGNPENPFDANQPPGGRKVRKAVRRRPR